MFWIPGFSLLLCLKDFLLCFFETCPAWLCFCGPRFCSY
uniref:Uncharacterized protein n=1 Tax=Anguilla anguilla TaxID=7936 RepID=A0A0E9Q175_ANGAN